MRYRLIGFMHDQRIVEMGDAFDRINVPEPINAPDTMSPSLEQATYTCRRWRASGQWWLLGDPPDVEYATGAGIELAWTRTTIDNLTLHAGGWVQMLAVLSDRLLRYVESQGELMGDLLFWGSPPDGPPTGQTVVTCTAPVWTLR